MPTLFAPRRVSGPKPYGIWKCSELCRGELPFRLEGHAAATLQYLRCLSGNGTELVITYWNLSP